MTSTVGIKLNLDADVGGFMSNVSRAKSTLSGMKAEMDKARDAGRYDDYGTMAVRYERLQAQNSKLERGYNTLAVNPRYQTITADGTKVFKYDSESLTVLRDQNAHLKRLYEKVDEALKSGETVTAQGLFDEIGSTQSKIGKTLEEANKPTMGQGMQDAVKTLGVMHIANAMNDGFSKWAASLDRSGIVSQYGSGNILQAQLADKQRVANLQGGMAQTILPLVGGILGTIALPKIGTMVGAGIGAGAGKAIDTALSAFLGREKTDIAYAELWQQRSADAMQIAALSGDPKFIRKAFGIAADAAAEFGYSAEEGMEAMKQAIQQGRSIEEAREVTERVFRYERSTGADRGTLSSAANIEARYKTGDILSAGWAGLQASGLDKGLFSEFLRGMQRVIEDGISKGFVRSADEVAHNLAMLSQMTGSPVWQGEQGINRLMQMNEGLAGTTGLQSTTDVRVYRAARNVLERNTEGPVHAVDVFRFVEQGLGHKLGMELLREVHRINVQAEGEDNRLDLGLALQKQFSLSTHILSDDLLQALNRGASESEVQRIMNESRELPDTSSPELDAARFNVQTANIYTQIGQDFFDELRTVLLMEREKAKQILDGRDTQPADTSEGATLENLTSQAAIEENSTNRMQDASSQVMRISGATDELFTERGDRGARRGFENIIQDAVYSSDPRQNTMAMDVLSKLESISPTDRQEMDRNNTLNPLANASGIESLLRDLLIVTREHLDATRNNGEVNVIVE